jgi:acyl-CoA hydrolase
MEIGIKVVAENIRTQVVRHANSCFFTMIAVGDDGKPVAVPPLQPSSPDEKRRAENAKVRRQLRSEMEQRQREMRSATPPADNTA